MEVLPFNCCSTSQNPPSHLSLGGALWPEQTVDAVSSLSLPPLTPSSIKRERKTTTFTEMAGLFFLLFRLVSGCAFGFQAAPCCVRRLRVSGCVTARRGGGRRCVKPRSCGSTRWLNLQSKSIKHKTWFRLCDSYLKQSLFWSLLCYCPLLKRQSCFCSVCVCWQNTAGQNLIQLWQNNGWVYTTTVFFSR